MQCKRYILGWLFILLAMAGTLEIQAQQDAMHTQYMFNTLMYNPAYAGSRDAFSAAAIYRHQWHNFDGAPKTGSVTLHGPVRDKYGLGLSLQYDSWGVHDWGLVEGSYAYRFYLTPTVKLSAGIQASMLYQQSNYTLVNSNTDNIDPTFMQDESRILPNFGAGLFLYSNRYYVGLSIPHILNNKLSALSQNAQQNRHYYLAAGIVLPLSNSLELKPSVLVKSVGSFAPTQAEINANLYIQKVVWVGATYRTGDSFDFLFGVQINPSLRFGYAFDLTTTEIRQEAPGGTHEIMIGYDFNVGRERVVTPRYF